MNVEDFPYLYNPVNGRVMINTPHKRQVCPNLIPCETLDGPPGYGPTVVHKAQEEPVVAEDVPPEKGEQKAAGPQALLAEVEESEDRDFVMGVAAQLGLETNPRWNLKTLKARVRKHVEALAEGKEPEPEAEEPEAED